MSQAARKPRSAAARHTASSDARSVPYCGVWIEPHARQPSAVRPAAIRSRTRAHHAASSSSRAGAAEEPHQARERVLAHRETVEARPMARERRGGSRAVRAHAVVDIRGARAARDRLELPAGRTEESRPRRTSSSRRCRACHGGHADHPTTPVPSGRPPLKRKRTPGEAACRRDRDPPARASTQRGYVPMSRSTGEARFGAGRLRRFRRGRDRRRPSVRRPSAVDGEHRADAEALPRPTPGTGSPPRSPRAGRGRPIGIMRR